MGFTKWPTIPNVRIENPEAAAHTRIGWFRSVSNMPHVLRDPVVHRRDGARPRARIHREYLLELLGPAVKIDPRKHRATTGTTARSRALSDRHGPDATVIERSPRKPAGGKLPKGQGLGLAADYSFVTYVAAVTKSRSTTRQRQGAAAWTSRSTAAA